MHIQPVDSSRKITGSSIKDRRSNRLQTTGGSTAHHLQPNVSVCFSSWRNVSNLFDCQTTRSLTVRQISALTNIYRCGKINLKQGINSSLTVNKWTLWSQMWSVLKHQFSRGSCLYREINWLHWYHNIKTDWLVCHHRNLTCLKHWLARIDPSSRPPLSSSPRPRHRHLPKMLLWLLVSSVSSWTSCIISFIL